MATATDPGYYPSPGIGPMPVPPHPLAETQPPVPPVEPPAEPPAPPPEPEPDPEPDPETA